MRRPQPPCGRFVLDMFPSTIQAPIQFSGRKSMIGYVTIGARDGEASGKFYDAFFGAFGYERKFADGGWIGYGAKGTDTHSVYVCPPFDGKQATAGNGIMIAFTAKSEDEVKAAYAAGL